MSQDSAAHDHEDHGIGHYIKVYLILLVLFAISVIGPELGIRTVTLITAFGIAIVKAWMVAAYFMHLNVEKRYIWQMMFAMLILVFLFFVGVSTDIMNTEGSNWKNQAAATLIEEHAQKADGEEKPH